MKGVLLINLGSPDSPEKKDVKKYLSQFLMDERVIDEPLWLRTLLVKGIILNTRHPVHLHVTDIRLSQRHWILVHNF